MRALALALLAGCNPYVDTSGDSTVDSDTDVTVETDVPDSGETDTVVDTDITVDTDLPPIEYERLDGTLTFTRVVNGVTVCDMDLQVESTGPYVGNCVSCDFAFAVQSDVTRINNSADCEQSRDDFLYTWRDSDADSLHGRWMGWTSDYSWIVHTSWGDTTYSYSDVLWAGTQYTFDAFAGTYATDGGSSYYYSYNDSGPIRDGATATFDGSTVQFASEERITNSSVPRYGASCYDTFGADGPGVLTTGEQGVDDLPCDGSVVDGWTFTAPANAVLAVTVDSSDPAHFGDSALTLYDPAGCEAAGRDDTFTCSVNATDGTARRWCPTWEGESTLGNGTWRLVVSMHGYGCADHADPTAIYQLTVSGADPGSLHLAAEDDDVTGSSAMATVTSIVGEAVVTPAN